MVFSANRLLASVWRSVSFAIADADSLRSIVYFGISDGYLSPPTPPFRAPPLISALLRWALSQVVTLPMDRAHRKSGIIAGREVGTLFVGYIPISDDFEPSAPTRMPYAMAFGRAPRQGLGGLALSSSHIGIALCRARSIGSAPLK